MKTDRIATANLGFPRIGARRELKVGLERFWAGEWNESQLEGAAREVHRARWQLQSDAGIARIPSNDFSLYDHVLDTAVMTGAIPSR
jgi:5-methyltetrahydropteroyltriglutamate--homocysteine methyltransferase